MSRILGGWLISSVALSAATSPPEALINLSLVVYNRDHLYHAGEVEVRTWSSVFNEMLIMDLCGFAALKIVFYTSGKQVLQYSDMDVDELHYSRQL